MIDIWHEPTETPTEHKTLLFDSIEFDETEMGVYSGGLFHSYNEFEPMTPAGLSRWAYLADFINCQKELDRTRKALDIAVDALKNVQKNSPENYTATQAVFLLAKNSVFVNNALEQITALEQKDVK